MTNLHIPGEELLGDTLNTPESLDARDMAPGIITGQLLNLIDVGPNGENIYNNPQIYPYYLDPGDWRKTKMEFNRERSGLANLRNYSGYIMQSNWPQLQTKRPIVSPNDFSKTDTNPFVGEEMKHHFLRVSLVREQPALIGVRLLSTSGFASSILGHQPKQYYYYNTDTLFNTHLWRLVNTIPSNLYERSRTHWNLNKWRIVRYSTNGTGWYTNEELDYWDSLELGTTERPMTTEVLYEGTINPDTGELSLNCPDCFRRPSTDFPVAFSTPFAVNSPPTQGEEIFETNLNFFEAYEIQFGTGSPTFIINANDDRDIWPSPYFHRSAVKHNLPPAAFYRLYNSWPPSVTPPYSANLPVC